MDGAAGRAADGRVLQQEHDRQGRVPADGRAGAALREHPGPPVARPVGGAARRAADPGSTGCSTTGSSEACMLGGLALLWRWRARRAAAGAPDWPAEPGHGRERPGLLGQVLPLLAGRAAAGADGAGPAAPDRGRGGGALRREHHRRGGGPRLHHGRQLRAGGGDQRRPGRPPGADRGGRARSTWTRPRAGSWPRSCSRT